jgi:hypothetical protein
VKHGVTPNSALRNFFSTASLETIDVLDLHRNYLGDRGILPVLDMLSHCKVLKRVVLSENGIRNNGAIALAQALKAHATVSSVDVSGNQISLGGGKALLELLATNPKIKDIGFANTRIDVQVRLKIKAQLEQNAAQ